MKKGLQERIEVGLDMLYLDPNNYRFIDLPKYTTVAKEAIIDQRVQKRTRNFILGEKNQNVTDLIKSFKANGYLEVDQIQVEKIGDYKYRVLEGNRRVSTLMYLQEQYEQGFDIGALSPEIFSKISVTLINQQREGEHKMVMALKHISGNKKWPTLNQAQLLSDLIDKFGWTEQQVTESVGITKHKLRRDLRTIALVELYKQSDYSDQFDTQMFSIFREIVSSIALKHWLDWDDNRRVPLDKYNTDRLFHWLSEISNEIENEEGVTEKKLPRIITNSDQVRTLASIIGDTAAIEYMEAERSIKKAYSVSKVVANDIYKNTLEVVGRHIDSIKLLSKHADEEDRQKIQQIKKEIDSILVSISGLGQISFEKNDSKVLYNYRNNQLQEIKLKDYKRFKNDFVFGPFNRVNIFAGNNNVGKTSILEAIFLLSQMNNFEGIYKVYQQRGKFTTGIPSDWLLQVIPINTFIEGVFDQRPVSLKISRKEELNSEIDKSSYKTSIYLEASHREEFFKNKIRIGKGTGKYEAYYEKLIQLCNVVISSPFVLQDRFALEHYYNIAVENGQKNTIVEFLRKEIDSNIESIEKGGSNENFRFLVTYKGSERPLDLTEFGDGIQRVFHISLMVVAAENGIICIDEIENAIHYKLLVAFTDFIQKLANEHNVQIFASTHSAECIKAFFENNYNNEEITGFRLINKDNKISSQKAIGKDFQVQLEKFSLDLRG